MSRDGEGGKLLRLLSDIILIPLLFSGAGFFLLLICRGRLATRQEPPLAVARLHAPAGAVDAPSHEGVGLYGIFDKLKLRTEGPS